MNDSNSDRHAFRAAWHDYNCGIYFVTICCHEKRHLFGKISDGSMQLSAIGSIAQNCIKMIPQHNTSVEVWNYIVMPNHIHMVISVQTPETSRPSHSLGCLKPPRHGEECENYHHDSILAVVIGTFKAAVTRLVRARYIAPASDGNPIRLRIPLFQPVPEKFLSFFSLFICTSQMFAVILHR